MASSTNVIKTLTIRSKAEGAQETTAALKGVESAYKGVAEVSEKSAKGQLSLADSVAKAERRFNATIRAQQDFEKVQRQMNMAVAQNPALQERVNRVLADARVHFDQVSRGQRAFATATQAANDNLRGFAQSAGPVGSILATLGPGGLAAAAGIGAVVLAFHQMATAATNLAERAGKLKDFAETTGFTVIQLQALEKAGAQVGVSSESVTKALERFSVQMDDVKQATGPLYQSLLQVDPALAAQIARTTSLSDAWDLLAVATRKADLEQRNVIARQAFGRGGIEITRLLGATASAGGLSGLIAELKKVDLITAQQAERWDTLGDKIAENTKAAKQNIAATFTGPVLDALNDYTAALLRLSRMSREASASGLGDTIADWTVKFLRALPVIGLVARGLQSIRDFGKGEGAAPLPSIDPGFDPSNSSFNAAAAARENLRKETIRLYNVEKSRMDVLGEAATASEKHRLKTMELAAAVAKDSTVTEEARRNLAAYNREQTESNLSRRISQLGEMASVEEIVRDKQNQLNRAIREGAEFTDQESAAILLRTRRQAELNTVQGQIKFDRATMFLSDTDKQIAQTLAKDFKTVEEALNSDQAAALRLNAALKEINSVAGEMASSFVKDLAHGVDVMDALRAAAGNLGNTLIDIGTKKLVSMAVDQAASMFGAGSAAAPAAILNTTAVTMGATWITSAQIAAGILAGESVQEATARVTSAQVSAGTLKVGGLEAGLLMNGPMLLLMAAIVAVGAILNMWSSSSSKQKQQEDEQARAAEAWKAAAGQLASFTALMNGKAVSTISTKMSEATDEASRLALLRSKAMGYSNLQQENADPVIRKMFEDLAKYGPRLKEEFQRSFQPTIDAMNSGLGEDSPLFQAIQRVKSVGEKLQEFLANVEFVYGKGSSQNAIARGAAQTQALSLLQQQDPLSEVQKRMQDIQGTASALQKVLEDLGMSSTDAARKIEEGVKQAIEALKISFGADLERQLNDLGGKGYFNDIFDVLAKNKENLKNNELLGGGKEDVIAQILGLSAQGIVDQFQLTGDAFQEFLKKFPELNGLVKEFVDKVGLLALNDRMFAATNDNSTPGGRLAEFDRNADRERLEAAKKGADYLLLLEKVLAAERGKIEEELAKQILQRRQSLEDDIFALTNDSTTVEGQLAELRRRQQRELLEASDDGMINYLLLLRKHQLEEEQIIKKANERKLEEVKRAAEEQQRAINSAARSVLDYIQGLQSGPGSTLSPTQILSNAKSAYDANLALAQGNPLDQATIDAVNNFSKVADNLEKAARSVYASGVGYQDIRSQIISEGLALPTVQAADDPLLEAMRRVAEATEATVEELTSTIKDAINAGNADAVATALSNSQLFKNIDLNTDNAISLEEMRDAFGTDYNTGTLQKVFNELDGNGNGILEKSELIKTNIGINSSSGIRADIAALSTQVSALSTQVGGVAAETIAGIRPITIDGPNALQRTIEGSNQKIRDVEEQLFFMSSNINDARVKIDEVNNAVGAVNRAIGLGEGSSTLQALNATAKDQLQLLNNQLTAGAVPSLPGQPGTPPGGGLVKGGSDLGTDPSFGTGFNNNTILALNKIVYNTAAIAHNTGHFFGGSPTKWSGRVSGILEQGGWIGGRPHSMGGTHIEAERGEFMVNRYAASALAPFMEDINRGRLPVIPSFANDNGSWAAVVAELRALRADNKEMKREIAAFRKENGVNTMNAARHVGEKVEETTEAVDGQTNKLKFEEQQNRQQGLRAGGRR